MYFSSFVFKVTDGGKYNGKIISIYLEKDDEGYETLMIRYDSSGDKKPCCVTFLSNTPGIIYLSGALTGQYCDITISIEQWLKILEKLNSQEKLDYWKKNIVYEGSI